MHDVERSAALVPNCVTPKGFRRPRVRGWESPAGDYRSDESFIRFECETGVGVSFDAHDSRKQLVWEVIDHRESVSKRAVHLLVSFMNDSGIFELTDIEVFAAQTPEGGDFSLRYRFAADRDPLEYGYTYFEVIFGCHEPPGERFWPFKHRRFPLRLTRRRTRRC